MKTLEWLVGGSVVPDTTTEQYKMAILKGNRAISSWTGSTSFRPALYVKLSE